MESSFFQCVCVFFVSRFLPIQNENKINSQHQRRKIEACHNTVSFGDKVKSLTLYMLYNVYAADDGDDSMARKSLFLPQ